MALKEGFFKQAGLNVTVKSVTQSTAAIPDLLHASIDVIGGGNYVSFFEAEAHGTFSVEILAPAIECAANTYGVVAMPSSGKTIAVNPHAVLDVSARTCGAPASAEGPDHHQGTT